MLLVASLLLVAMPFAPSSFLAPSSDALVPSSAVASLLLVVRPGAPSSVLAPSSDARHRLLGLFSMDSSGGST